MSHTKIAILKIVAQALRDTADSGVPAAAREVCANPTIETCAWLAKEIREYLMHYGTLDERREFSTQLGPMLLDKSCDMEGRS